jgi:hypothetical protein
MPEYRIGSTSLSKPFMFVTQCFLLYVFLGEANILVSDEEMKALLQIFSTLLRCFRCCILCFVEIDITYMFRLLRNVFEDVVSVVNNPLILTSDVRFSQCV